MMIAKLTLEQLAKFLSNPTPENLKALTATPDASAKTSSDLIGSDGLLKATRKHHMTDVLDGEKLADLANSRVTEDDLTGVKNEAIKLIERLGSDPGLMTNPTDAVKIIGLAFLDVFKIGYRSAIGDVIYRDVDPESCRVQAPKGGFEAIAGQMLDLKGEVPPETTSVKPARPSYKRSSKR